MKYLFIILFCITILSFGCNKENDMSEKQLQYSSNIESFVDFKILDSKSNNLLSDDVSNHLTSSDIDLVYYENGKEKVYFNSLMDASKGYLIFGKDSTTYIRLFLNKPDTKNESVTYLRIGKNNVLDTFKAKYEVASNENTNGSYIGKNIIVLKVWCNNTLLYDKDVLINNLSNLPVVRK